MNPSRRQALGLLGLGLSAPWFAGCSAREPQLDPFTLGVASGDPAADGFVIWTRLAPDPLAEDGLGGLHAPVEVQWEVALDPGLRQVVQSGTVQAQPGASESHRSRPHAAAAGQRAAATQAGGGLLLPL